MSGPVLWLLRHGKAAESLGVPDAGRPLTERGEAQSIEAGQTLASFGVRLDAVLTSPRLRARNTASLAVGAHGEAPTPQVFGELGGDYDAADLLALVSPWVGVGRAETDATPPASSSAAASGEREGLAGRPSVLVVGHNPTLTVVVHALTGDERTLATGTLVAIDLDERVLLHHLEASA